ncbi:MAG: helix-turn-helix transcriptional regulator [Lachnospiraceae bacterium]|nr:helix-turn-helix transcriptional regulator [Lachnospiraceae bacterium]
MKNTENICKIRQLREKLGLRRTEFGARIGCSYLQIERIEDGIIALNDELSEKICREYGVAREWLEGYLEEEPELEESDEKRRNRLRTAFEESGLSQREFARQTNTTASMLRDVISGRKKLTIRYAGRIEEAMGIGADWLLYGDEDAKDYPLSDTVIRYMKKHPEIRKDIYRKMEADATMSSKDEAT